jgi:hypothetical protein
MLGMADLRSSVALNCCCGNGVTNRRSGTEYVLLPAPALDPQLFVFGRQPSMLPFVLNAYLDAYPSTWISWQQGHTFLARSGSVVLRRVGDDAR